ncbi:FMN-binding negative transcriptional regulator [Undibacter mobilis]|uniref:FMN-binding negative transcriptional regulator n=1 Tax=Undibacter mobilis TaxID=2292256 RepID=A0A371BA44_9BRAD|nr:FMN-binding negative transcriptional regulator [Undibacter mobilis]RDV04273.1 FMN-binding negative transcriptional regulator [Undibacter mobilis]
MYQPPHFREDRIDVQHALIAAHPLGLLITSGPGGLQANPAPFLIDAGASERGTLRAHLARANPQLAELAAVSECLVVFQGPQHYISPSLYPTKQETGKVVPTWNYITVHAWGTPRVMDNAAWLRQQIDDLTRHNERGQRAPWNVSDAPDTFIAAQIKGIVGVEIPIARIEGKWKVSQNRTAADQQGVAAGLRGLGSEADMLANEVAARGKAH